MKFFIQLAIGFFISATALQAADLIYVNSKKANLYQQDNYNSSVMSELKKGQELEVLEDRGKWLNVKYSTIKGWVPRYSTSSTKPKQLEFSFFSRIKRFFSSNEKRSRVSTVSTAGGIRGLAEGENESSGNKDYKSVEKMEQSGVTSEEVQTFVEGNKR